MDNFDNGVLAEPTFSDKIFEVVGNILQFPIAFVSVKIIPVNFLPGMLGHVPIILNSYLWSIVFWKIYQKYSTKTLQ